MESRSYSDLANAIGDRVLSERIPVCGTIEVTQRCPLRCVHCYNNLPLYDREARRLELSLEEHCRILDEITEAGCLWLLFTGGEIFARRDFLEIYTHAKKNGLLITLFTNGTLITPRVVDYLAEWPPFSIEISLYGRTQATYEQVTGVRGSFEKCLRGIELILERRLPLKLKTMAMTLNKHEIQEMKRFAEEKLGVSFRFDAMINPRIDTSPAPLAVRLTPEEVLELDLADPKRMKEWSKFCERFPGPIPPDRLDQLYQCGAGVNSFVVDPYGRLGLCVLSRKDLYDLRNGRFREGWEDFLLRVRRKRITRMTKCIPCRIRAFCGMCPANGALENLDAEEPVDFLCRVTYLRAKALGLTTGTPVACESRDA